MFDFLKSLTPDSIYEALILRQVKVAHVNEGRIRFLSLALCPPKTPSKFL